MAICKPSEPAGGPPEYEELMKQIKDLQRQLAEEKLARQNAEQRADKAAAAINGALKHAAALLNPYRI